MSKTDILVAHISAAKKKKRPLKPRVAIRAAGAQKSDILATIHESMNNLHTVGAIPLETMREFEELCLEG